MAIRRGRFDEGLRRAQQARSDAIAIFGDRSLAVADAEVALGIVFNGLHKRDRSVEHFVRAAQLQEQVLSPNHPAVGKSWAFAGYAMCTAGQLKEGLEAARKGLAISRRSLSPESPDLAHRLWMVAGCSLLGEGRTKEQPELTEALAIVADRPGIDRVNVWFNVGVSKFFQGKYLEGREAFTKALVDAPLDTPTVSYPLYGLGRCELELGNLNEARTAFGRARAAASSEAPIAEIEGFLGITEWRLGERAESVVRIRRTCAVMRRSQWWEFIDNRFIESFTRAVHEFPELERACEDTP